MSELPASPLRCLVCDPPEGRFASESQMCLMAPRAVGTVWVPDKHCRMNVLSPTQAWHCATGGLARPTASLLHILCGADWSLDGGVGDASLQPCPALWLAGTEDSLNCQVNISQDHPPPSPALVPGPLPGPVRADTSVSVLEDLQGLALASVGFLRGQPAPAPGSVNKRQIYSWLCPSRAWPLRWIP